MRFLLLSFFTSLSAAEFTTSEAKPREVTVYSDRAEVVRIFKGQLAAGEHSLLFENLPADIDFSSIRVEGIGKFTLIDIRPETTQLKEVSNEHVRTLESQVEAQELIQKELTQAEVRLNFHREALNKVLNRLTTVGKESANAEMDPAKWAAYLDFQAKQMTLLDQESKALTKRMKASRLLLDKLQREISALNANRNRSHYIARVNLEMQTIDTIELRFIYVVHGPSWEPVYDLRADTKEKNLEITYHAEVRQSTGEDWLNVALRLSTAQPSIGGREPAMPPWFLAKAEADDYGINKSRKDDENRLKSEILANRFGAQENSYSQNFLPSVPELQKQSTPINVTKEAAVSTARVITRSTSAAYVIERKTDIKSDNRVAKVTVMRLSLPSTFRHTCVPKHSPFVYLKTHATNKSDYTILPGKTAIFLDGSFVANASMDLVPAGQDFWTFLGVDQSVSVEKKLLACRSESTGYFGKKTQRTVFDQVFKVKNGKPTEIDLVIWDQLPIGDHEDIKVILEVPKYEKNSPSFKMTETKFVEWRHAIKPSEKLDVPYRFAVEHPEDMKLEGL